MNTIQERRIPVGTNDGKPANDAGIPVSGDEHSLTVGPTVRIAKALKSG